MGHKAVWIYPNGSGVDRVVCDSLREAMWWPVHNDADVLTLVDLARVLTWRRERVARTAETLGILARLKKTLKNKRESRKDCGVSAAQKSASQKAE
jgi:hypothetical protein